METYTLATSLSCGGCVAAVSKKLNELDGVSEWSVDLEHDSRLLTVQAENLTENDIISAVRSAGFAADPYVED